MLSQDEMLPLTVNPDNTQTGHIEIRQLGIVPLPHRRFRNGNSTKEAINIMKPKQIIISILAVLFVFPLMGTFAQQAANSGSIEVITTFDYPGAGNSTLPQKINERGDIVGEFVDSTGVTRGFVRFSDGSFSAPIVDPNDTVGFTEGRGINNPRTVVGDYVEQRWQPSLVFPVGRHLHRIRCSRRGPDRSAFDKRSRRLYRRV